MPCASRFSQHISEELYAAYSCLGTPASQLLDATPGCVCVWLTLGLCTWKLCLPSHGIETSILSVKLLLASHLKRLAKDLQYGAVG